MQVQEFPRKSQSPEPQQAQPRLSPLRDRVGSPAGESSLKRTQSCRRADSLEKPKGILKRTPSLKHSGVIVDNELASILERRRQQEGEEEEETQSSGIDPKRDIEETLK